MYRKVSKIFKHLISMDGNQGMTEGVFLKDSVSVFTVFV